MVQTIARCPGTSTFPSIADLVGLTAQCRHWPTASKFAAKHVVLISILLCSTCSIAMGWAVVMVVSSMALISGFTRSPSRLEQAFHMKPHSRTWLAPQSPRRASARTQIGLARLPILPELALPSLTTVASALASLDTQTSRSLSMGR